MAALLIRRRRRAHVAAVLAAMAEHRALYGAPSRITV
jgi:hypothetical protein